MNVLILCAAIVFGAVNIFMTWLVLGRWVYPIVLVSVWLGYSVDATLFGLWLVGFPIFLFLLAGLRPQEHYGSPLMETDLVLPKRHTASVRMDGYVDLHEGVHNGAVVTRGGWKQTGEWRIADDGRFFVGAENLVTGEETFFEAHPMDYALEDTGAFPRARAKAHGRYEIFGRAARRVSNLFDSGGGIPVAEFVFEDTGEVLEAAVSPYEVATVNGYVRGNERPKKFL